MSGPREEQINLTVKKWQDLSKLQRDILANLAASPSHGGEVDQAGLDLTQLIDLGYVKVQDVNDTDGKVIYSLTYDGLLVHSWGQTYGGKG